MATDPIEIELRDDQVQQSATIGKLALALSHAQAEITPASKDSHNPFFKSNYADLASVWEACRAALAKNELAVIQMPGAINGKITLTTKLIHSSGEWVGSTLSLKPAKDDAQSAGSAITYARRYALAAMVGVFQDDDDGNLAAGKDHTHVAEPQRVSEKNHEPQPKSQAQPPAGTKAKSNGASETEIKGILSAIGKEAKSPKGKNYVPLTIGDKRVSLLDDQYANLLGPVNQALNKTVIATCARMGSSLILLGVRQAE